MKDMVIGKRKIGPNTPPFVIAEIGINHEGDYNKAIKMVDDAYSVGCECVKFQCHILDDEMIPNDVVPIHTNETIWDIMVRCSLSEDEERGLKKYVESKGMIYLCTPFSRAAAERLESMGVIAYKIGSGECNNYPLIKHIASYSKPVILSTGMNDITSITPAVEILRKEGVPYALMHCTSMYPTPYDKVRLGAIPELAKHFPDAVVGLSDHSIGVYTSLAAVALGADLLEKHFTSDKSWPGPDVPVSLDPKELKELLDGSKAVYLARGGHKNALPEERPTMNFAFATVVTIKNVKHGEPLSMGNAWVKRPGTGKIFARDFERVLGRKAKRDLPKGTQVSWEDLT